MGKDSTSNSASESVLAVYAALGGPTRLALMVSLRGRPFSVGELAVKIGASKANVSHQLGILGSVDDSSDLDEAQNKLNGAQKHVGQFVVACRDRPELLHFVE